MNFQFDRSARFASVKPNQMVRINGHPATRARRINIGARKSHADPTRERVSSDCSDFVTPAPRAAPVVSVECTAIALPLSFRAEARNPETQRIEIPRPWLMMTPSFLPLAAAAHAAQLFIERLDGGRRIGLAGQHGARRIPE